MFAFDAFRALSDIHSIGSDMEICAGSAGHRHVVSLWQCSCLIALWKVWSKSLPGANRSGQSSSIESCFLIQQFDSYCRYSSITLSVGDNSPWRQHFERQTSRLLLRNLEVIQQNGITNQKPCSLACIDSAVAFHGHLVIWTYYRLWPHMIFWCLGFRF